MKENTFSAQALGKSGEELALKFLEKKKYRIISRGYRLFRGEIDIIAEHKDFLVFIEVRTKTSLEFGHPEESITFTKKERLRVAAYHYRQDREDLPPLWRIDFVAVELDPEGQPSRIELIENAVGGE